MTDPTDPVTRVEPSDPVAREAGIAGDAFREHTHGAAAPQPGSRDRTEEDGRLREPSYAAPNESSQPAYRRLNWYKASLVAGVLVAAVGVGWYLTREKEEAVPTNPAREASVETPVATQPEPKPLTFGESIQGITDRYVQETRGAARGFVLGVRDKRVQKTGEYRADLERNAGEILNPERKQYLEDADRVLQEKLGENQEGN